MLALAFILVSYLIGFIFRQAFNLGESGLEFIYKRAPKLKEIPIGIILLPIDLSIGLYLTTTLNYFTRLFLLEDIGSSLLLSTLTLALTLGLLVFLRNRKQALAVENASPARPNYNAKYTVLLIILQILVLAYALFLTQRSFFRQGGFYEAGVTVFSDLAPHTALVRNFGVGGNVPTSYPHFADAGMNYHFMFYYMAGILNALGLPLDLALNLPSALGIYTFMTLLGLLGTALTNRINAWGLTQLLFVFRSSWSGFAIFFKDLAQTNNFTQSLSNLFNSITYSGPLQHDDWGLYNLNVYANQRHLLFVLSIALWILINFLPLLAEKKNNDEGEIPTKTKPTSWLSIVALSLIGFTMSYWHGSVTIALDLILIIWALFSVNKLKYLSFGLSTVIGAFFMLRFFTVGNNGTDFLSTDIFHWAYYLENKSLGSVLNFLWILFGLAFILMLIAPFLQKDRTRRIITTSLWLPVLFALTISLTPDVTVNHKYFMITQILFLPFIVDLLFRLGDFKAKSKINIFAKAATVILVFALTFTGLTDFWTYKNASIITTRVAYEDSFSDWLQENTEDNSVNITPPWHYHTYYINGRQSWYGWSYYSSSAGYDVNNRLNEVRIFVAAENFTKEAHLNYAQANNLQYLMIDDFWRGMDDYTINEVLLDEWFELVAYFPEQANLRIYELK